MQMASSSILSLSVLVLLFCISSAYTRKWSSSDGLNENPIKIIETAIDVSEDLLELNVMGPKNDHPGDGKSQTIIVGPWGAKVGSSNGVSFDDGGYTGIREINFEYNSKTAIGGFQVTYDLNGKPFAAPKHPSYITGFQSVKISLDFPNEYIVEVSGYIGKVEGYVETVIRSLTFKTNKKTYGPYGVTSGTAFSLPIENGLVVGFKGSVGYWLDYIAIYLSL